MRPELRARAARQGGVVTRAQAVACGYTEPELKTRTGHDGEWVAVRRGCHVERLVWDEADEDGRHLPAAWAVSLTCRGDAVASHASAARCVPRGPRGGSRRHAELARCHRGGDAVAGSDPGAQTIGECLLRLVVLELGLGRPQTQFEIRDGDRHAAVDLRLGRHLFEFDGRVRYLDREAGGVADLPPEKGVWREKQREDRARRADGGYGASRVAGHLAPVRRRDVATGAPDCCRRPARRRPRDRTRSVDACRGVCLLSRVHNPASHEEGRRENGGAPESSPAAIPALRLGCK